MRELKIELASLPDRDDIVAEIWHGNQQIAEVYNIDSRRCGVILFKNEAFLEYESLLSALETARARIRKPILD